METLLSQLCGLSASKERTLDVSDSTKKNSAETKADHQSIIWFGDCIASWVDIGGRASDNSATTSVTYHSELGRRLGVLATLLFVTTLLPGILMRLRPYSQSLIPLATIITPFRRHLGILMFLSAFVHMSFTTTLPYVAFNGWQALPPPVEILHIAGSLAWLILLPVWLTSNDVSMKKLGKNWKRLQRLTYVAIWFVFGHLVLVGSPLALLVIVVAILEVASWGKFLLVDQRNAR